MPLNSKENRIEKKKKRKRIKKKRIKKKKTRQEYEKECHKKQKKKKKRIEKKKKKSGENVVETVQGRRKVITVYGQCMVVARRQSCETMFTGHRNVYRHEAGSKHKK